MGVAPGRGGVSVGIAPRTRGINSATSTVAAAKPNILPFILSHYHTESS